MNAPSFRITRDVITDLWPLFEAGEASRDTRALVKEFLDGDPVLARQLQAQSAEPLPPAAIPALPPDREAQALKQTRKILHGQDWLMLLAFIFSGLAFGRIVSDTSWDVSPRNFIITAAIAGVFWIAYLGRLYWIQRKVYRPRQG
jgi:hypothetical protein